MDWNKWIREGVPYVNRQAAQKLKDSLMPKEDKASDGKKEAPRARMVLTKESDIHTTGNAIAALRTWLADESKKDETEFEVIETNAYLRRFMHETLAADFTDLTVESRPTPRRGLSKMFVLRLTEAQKTERAAKLRLEKEAELIQKIGFQRVFSALVDAKKTVVGHAVLYDLLFAMSHFEGQLPESFAKFQEQVHDLFPFLFCTQFLVKSEPFKFLPQAKDAEAGSKRQHRFGSIALGAVYKVLMEEAEVAKRAGQPTVEVTFAPGHNRYSPDCGAFHEAGYDAYVTGCAFAHMAKQALCPEWVSTLKGRTTMFRSLYHFNLYGEDELIAKGIYVHACGLKGREEKSLRSAFTEIQVPGGEGSIEIRWIDDDSAFAILPETCGEAVAAMLDRVGLGGGKIDGLSLAPFSDWRSAQGVPDASDEAVKEPALKRARISA